MAFDGSIEAIIGADLTGYEKAMSDVVSSTRKAFQNAAQEASKSANQMIREVGELMNRLANSNQNIGSKIGQGLTGGFKIALGELQRISSNIGAKLPDPIRRAFTRVSGDIKSVLSTMKNDVATLGAGINSKIKKAFDFNISNAIKSPKSAFAEMANSVDSMAQRISSKVHSIGSVFTNSANNMSGSYKTAFGAIGDSMARLEARIQSTAGSITSALGQKVLNPINSSWSSMFTGLTSKANSFADRVKNSFGGKILSSVSNLASTVSGRLGNAFQTAGQKAVGALTSIVSHTDRATSASTNLLKQVLGVAAAYKLFDLGKQAIKSTVSKAAEFEAKMSNIKAVTGESEATMKKFNDAAIKAGADTAFSAAEAADAIGELAKAGVSTKDILNGGLTASLNLATAGELDLKEAAEITSTALNAFKRDGMTATQAANQLAGAANASATDVHELKYGLSMVAPVASGLGLSFRDTTNALAVFAQNGLKGSDAGTSLKTMLMNLQPQTKAQTNMMKELGIITADGSNQFFTAEGKIKSFAEISQVLKDHLGGLTDAEKQMALKTMFGTDAVRAATIAMNEGADGANNMQEAIDKVTAAQVAAEKLNNLKGAVEALSGSWETLQIQVGTAVLPVLTTLVKWIDKLVDKISNSQGLQKFLDALNSLNPALNQFLNGTKMTEDQANKFESTMIKLKPAIMGVVGALAFGPATKGLSKMTSLLGNLSIKAITTGSTLGNAFEASANKLLKINKAGETTATGFRKMAGQGLSVMSMMTNGISSVMSVVLAAIGPAAILGLVLAGLGLVNQQFGKQIDQLITLVTTKGPMIIQNLVNGITSQLPSLIASGADLVAKLAQGFATMFPVIVNAGIQLIGSLVQGVGQNASSLISSAVTIIGTLANSLLSALPQLLAIGMQLLLSITQGILQNLPQILSTAKQIVTNFITNMQAQFPQILQQGIQILMNVVQGIIQALPTIIDIATQVIVGFIQTILSNLPTILQGGIQLIVALVQGLINALPKIAQSGAQIIGQLIMGLAKALPQLAMAGVQLVVQLATSLITGIPKIVGAAWDIIKGFGGALLNFIPNALKGVADAVGNFFGGIWDWISGKSEAGGAKVEATIGATAEHISNKSSETTAKVSSDATTANTNVSTNYQQMQANVSTSTNTMTADVSNNMMNLANSTMTTTSTMQQGVSTNFGMMNADGTMNMQQLAMNADTSFNQMNANAVAQTGQMNTGVTTNIGQLNANASNELNQLMNNANASTAGVNTAATTNAQLANSGVVSNFQQMQAGATSATNAMANNAQADFAKVSQQAQQSSAQLSQAVTANYNQMKTAVTNSMNATAQAVQAGLNKISQVSSSAGKQLESAFKSTFQSVTNSAKSGMQAFTSTMQSSMNQAVSLTRSTCAQISASFGLLPAMLQMVGFNAGVGLYNGLASMAGSLYALASSIASNIASVMRSALSIHSPSRVTKKIGGFTGEGMYLGMRDWVSDIKDMARQYAQAITDQDYQTNSVLTTSASVTSSGVRSSLEDLSDEVKNSQLSNQKFEVHNEIVGDKIYTTIKEKDAREKALDAYFT
nr:MAG TPA: minor tail protein [Caudoviricetes sp.]